MNNIGTDGRIHGSVNSLGTVTFRCTHNNPNMSQVPSIVKPYGHECRALFAPDVDGWVQLGSDLSGIEARLLGHFCSRFDDGALNDIIMNGDIHEYNRGLAGLATRSEAKVMFYALMYGCGDAYLGKILGGGRYKGAKTRKTFMSNMKAYATLLNRLGNYRKAHDSTIRTIDGRHIYVSGAHTMLNYLLQSSGSIIAKRWMQIFHDEVKARGYVWGKDYAQLGFYHDEFQLGVKAELAEEFGQITLDSALKAGEYYKLSIPIEAEYKVGLDWEQCH